MSDCRPAKLTVGKINSGNIIRNPTSTTPSLVSLNDERQDRNNESSGTRKKVVGVETLREPRVS